MDYGSILNGAVTPSPSVDNNTKILASQASNTGQQTSTTQLREAIPGAIKLFDIQEFIDALAEKSANKNASMRKHSVSINSYDIAHNCIREVVFKILNYPVESFEDVWLPIQMRAALGNAIHDFVQSTYPYFTETEVSIKVPSIRASVRTDGIINDNVLVEIKSCTYDDYRKIINSRRPRDADFFQTVYNKYLLENHLEESKKQTTRSRPPKLDKYDIRYIQLLYVAHDLTSAECKSMSECIDIAKKTKKLLNSKNNPFHYMNVVTIDLNVIDITPHLNYIIAKLNAINHYLNTNTIPPVNDPFISKNCHFCLYKRICSQSNGG